MHASPIPSTECWCAAAGKDAEQHSLTSNECVPFAVEELAVRQVSAARHAEHQAILLPASLQQLLTIQLSDLPEQQVGFASGGHYACLIDNTEGAHLHSVEAVLQAFHGAEHRSVARTLSTVHESSPTLCHERRHSKKIVCTCRFSSTCTGFSAST